jgi:hypothetical protein
MIVVVYGNDNKVSLVFSDCNNLKVYERPDGLYTVTWDGGSLGGVLNLLVLDDGISVTEGDDVTPMLELNRMADFITLTVEQRLDALEQAVVELEQIPNQVASMSSQIANISDQISNINLTQITPQQLEQDRAIVYNFRSHLSLVNIPLISTLVQQLIPTYSGIHPIAPSYARLIVAGGYTMSDVPDIGTLRSDVTDILNG